MGQATAFDAVGGFARVRLIVSDFYDKVLASERLAPFFAGTDMRRLIDHQTKFISAVMGGPAAFSDEQMKRAHTTLGIDDPDFDEMISLLRETLEDFGVKQPALGRIEAHVQSMRRLVVTSSEGTGDHERR
jgi:hemoglobin